jgi:hypothetical protein
MAVAQFKALFRYLSGRTLENIKNRSENSPTPGRDSNHTPLEYKSVTLPPEPPFTAERKQLPFLETRKKKSIKLSTCY